MDDKQKEIEELNARIKQLEEFIEAAPVSSGVCCCGSNMDAHPSSYIDGHVPVDEWDYSRRCILDESPRQSLNHIKAQVEEETILKYRAALRKRGYMVATKVSDTLERKYAKQAGPTVEEGE